MWDIVAAIAKACKKGNWNSTATNAKCKPQILLVLLGLKKNGGGGEERTNFNSVQTGAFLSNNLIHSNIQINSPQSVCTWTKGLTKWWTLQKIHIYYDDRTGKKKVKLCPNQLASCVQDSWLCFYWEKMHISTMTSQITDTKPANQDKETCHLKHGNNVHLCQTRRNKY